METVPVDTTPPATVEGDNVKLIADPVGRPCPNEKPVTKQRSKTKAKQKHFMGLSSLHWGDVNEEWDRDIGIKRVYLEFAAELRIGIVGLN